MKFGKEFRTHLEETLPEWREKFLCYKPLKKLLKRFPHTISVNNIINHNPFNINNIINTQNQDDLGHNNGGPTVGAGVGGPSSSGSGFTERSMSLEEFQDWFVRLLNDELDKLNDFYVEKEEDFVIRFQWSTLVRGFDSEEGKWGFQVPGWE
ncbi:SPX domain-containing protein 4 [Bienertia sinuspersici]